MVQLSTRKKDEREDSQAKKASSTVSPAYILRSALRERERHPRGIRGWWSRLSVGLANSRWEKRIGVL